MTFSQRFQNLPIRHKLNAIILVTCAAVLFLAASSFVLYEAYRFRTDLLDQYTTLGGVLATNSAAAIVFRDAKAGADTLAALRSDPHVIHASLTSGDGTLLADYLRIDRTETEKDEWARALGYASWRDYQLDLHAAAVPYQFHRDRLDLWAPVVLDGETIGTLLLQIDLERLYASLWGYTLTVAGVFLTSLVLALLLSQKFQRVISEPILLLAKRMGHVSADRDYAVRVEKQNEDEIGALFDGFNDMLSQIERRDQELTRLAAAVEQAPDGIAILDFDGRILHGNREFLKLTGCLPEQLPTLASAALYPASLGTRTWQGVLDGAREGSSWTGRVKALRVDGSEYDEFCSVAPILAESGRVVNLLLLKRDITREMQMEERVRESQKLQALGTLAGGIAHDFNNLMSPIVAYSELLMGQAEPGSKDHTRLERITSAALEASALVKQILAFSRPGSEAKHALSVQSLVKECVKLFHMALPPNIAVTCEVDAELPPVCADPSQLHQVLMNLLTNAKHAMKEQGKHLRCRVEAATPSLEEVPEFPAVAGTPCVCISVEDEGYGMSAEVRERIFEPFFSTKGLGEGTGMGLAVVRGIVEDHGGAIRVDSEPGRGSTFWVYLPVAGAPELPSVGDAPPEAVAGTERLLVLEADETLCEPLCAAIALLGYRVDGVATPAQVLEQLAAAGPYDALVVDEQALGVNGEGVLGEVRRLSPELALLVCCDASGGEVRERHAGMGRHALVPKPISPIAIGAALRTLDGGGGLET